MPGCVHGSCQQPWQCSCEKGWGGRFCDKDLNACSQQQPCQNGATCLMEGNGNIACVCPEGFHGNQCERRTGPCHQRRSLCKNGGLCEDSDGFATEPTCRCLAGFTGHRCETDIDDCQMMPCANGATCLDGVSRFSCLCPDGFSGRFCTINLDDCASRPCLNGGRCLDLAGGFRCVCGLGFSGANCEMPLSSVDGPQTAQRSWTTVAGWEGGGRWTTGSGGGNSSHHGDRAVRVTMSERSATGLSDVQLVVVLVLVGVTVAVVILTATLLLWVRCNHAPCWSSSQRQLTSGWRGDEEDGHTNFHNTEQPQKKRLNTEVRTASMQLNCDLT
ncbi:uncharacterized protein dlk2 isoform 2-T2 [Pholidichthys leucotaenia]